MLIILIFLLSMFIISKSNKDVKKNTKNEIIPLFESVKGGKKSTLPLIIILIVVLLLLILGLYNWYYSFNVEVFSKLHEKIVGTQLFGIDIISKIFGNISDNVIDKIEEKKKNSKIFVEIVENRRYRDKSSIDLIKSKLDIVKKFYAKRVILGCTHYPYLEPIFKNILEVEYFDPALSLASIVKEKIGNEANGNNIEFFVSKNPDEFIKSAEMFFDVEHAELVQLN